MTELFFFHHFTPKKEKKKNQTPRVCFGNLSPPQAPPPTALDPVGSDVMNLLILFVWRADTSLHPKHRNSHSSSMLWSPLVSFPRLFEMKCGVPSPTLNHSIWPETPRKFHCCCAADCNLAIAQTEAWRPDETRQVPS